MAKQATSLPLLEILRDAFVGLVKANGPDLSSRGLAIFLICCREGAPATVRGLAGEMQVSKPSVTRSIDRLETLGLLRRKPDVADRRSVLVALTPAGQGFRRRIGRLLVDGATRG